MGEVNMLRSTLLGAVAALVAVAGCNTNHLVDLSGSVAGTVCDPLTGRPAPGVSVTAEFTSAVTGKAATRAATADSKGFFKVGGLPVATVKLHVVDGNLWENDIPDVKIGGDQETQLTDPACREPSVVPGKGEVDGQVCNRHTGNYVSNATVSVQLPDGTSVSTTTDADGRFSLPDVPAGPQVLIVDGSGFRRSFAVTVVAGKQVELDSTGITCQPYDKLTTGFVYGDLCGSTDNGQTAGPLVGAHVFITSGINDGNTYEDYTDDNGHFEIDGIPTSPTPPVVQVRAEMGGFVYTWAPIEVQSVAATNGNGTQMPNANGGDCQTLNPDDGRRYLVITGTYDRIEHVLDRMGISSQVDLVDGTDSVPNSDWTVQAFGDKTKLETYDAVFINCGIDDVKYQGSGLGPAERANIEDYIKGGGNLYVSDWAYNIITEMWPDEINFLGNDSVVNDAEHGKGEQTYTVKVIDSGLEQYIGSPTIQIDFKFDNFVVVSQVAPGVTIFLQANEQYYVNNSFATLQNTPMTVGFQPYGATGGRVIFTSFHQEQDASQLCSTSSTCQNGLECIDGACTANIDGPEDQVLRYIIFSL
jgi:hypothetical protein